MGAPNDLTSTARHPATFVARRATTGIWLRSCRRPRYVISSSPMHGMAGVVHRAGRPGRGGREPGSAEGQRDRRNSGVRGRSAQRCWTTISE